MSDWDQGVQATAFSMQCIYNIDMQYFAHSYNYELTLIQSFLRQAPPCTET